MCTEEKFEKDVSRSYQELEGNEMEIRGGGGGGGGGGGVRRCCDGCSEKVQRCR